MIDDFYFRDFALRNCLVTVERTVKVGDYGLSEELYKVRSDSVIRFVNCVAKGI